MVDADAAGEKPRESKRRRVFWRVYRGVLVVNLVYLAAMHPVSALFVAATLLALSAIVVAHEYGHYRVARKAGLGINEFSVGFGPRLISRERHGVRWSIKAIPLGGSVDIQGMTVEQVDKHGVSRESAFVHASMRTRITLAVAGPAVNLVLAWVGLTVAAFGLAPHGTPVWKLILLSPVIGAVVLWRAFGLTLTALAHTITGSFSDVHSVIALPHVLHSGVDQAATTGIPVWAVAVALFGLINLSLAVVNALPLYPLDGYHALLAVIDGVRRFVARRHGRVVGPLARAQMSWYTRTTGVVVGLFSAVLLGRDLISLFNGTLP